MHKTNKLVPHKYYNKIVEDKASCKVRQVLGCRALGPMHKDIFGGGRGENGTTNNVKNNEVKQRNEEIHILVYENHNHFWMSNGGTNVEHTPKQTKLKDQRDREQYRERRRGRKRERDCTLVCELILKQTHVRKPADTCINCYVPRAESGFREVTWTWMKISHAYKHFRLTGQKEVLGPNKLTVMRLAECV